MSYFKNLMDTIRNKLPLRIDQVKWDGTSYYMGGIKWNYNSLADWVVVNSEIMIIGCHDDKIEAFINEEIIGKEIIDLQPSFDLPSYDPIFVLSNKIKIKFFSTSIIEPWTFRFDENKMFVASPSDDGWVLKNF